MKYRILLLLMLGVSATRASAQIFIEEYPDGQTRHEGPMVDGIRTGTHTYYFNNGQKEAVIEFSSKGTPLSYQTWDVNGNPVEEVEVPSTKIYNLPKPEFSRTESGLEYSIDKVESPQMHDRTGKKVTVHYAGYLDDGSEFDNSKTRGKPFRYKAGAGQVILGFEEAVSLLKPGQSGWFRIPPDLAYGNMCIGIIPPYSALWYRLELLSEK